MSILPSAGDDRSQDCASWHPNIRRAYQQNPYFVEREAPVVVLTATKSPATKYAKRYGTPRDWIAQWATSPKHAKTAGLGLKTGHEAGVLVLDEDQARAVELLFAATGIPIPLTAVAVTGSGKLHFYFRYDARIHNSQNAPEGIDVRAQNGIIVLPGSIHPDTKKPYAWRHAPGDVGIAVLPEPVARLVLAAQGRDARGKKIRASRQAKAAVAPRTQEAVAETATQPQTSPAAQPAGAFRLPEAIPDGMRDETLFYFASSLRGRGVSRAEAERRLLEANAVRCQPPLGRHQVLKKMDQAWQYEEGARADASGRDPCAPKRYWCKTTQRWFVGNAWLPAPMSREEEEAFLARRNPVVGELLMLLRRMQSRSPFLRYSHPIAQRELKAILGFAPAREALKYALRVLEKPKLIRRHEKAQGQAYFNGYYEILVSHPPLT